ncbi:MAG: hypothetical protein AAFN81_34835 [Bacteroidota bacterium]
MNVLRMNPLNDTPSLPETLVGTVETLPCALCPLHPVEGSSLFGVLSVLSALDFSFQEAVHKKTWDWTEQLQLRHDISPCLPVDNGQVHVVS